MSIEEIPPVLVEKLGGPDSLLAQPPPSSDSLNGEMCAMPRGAFQFETNDAGDLSNSATNVEILRRLWLHHTLVSGSDIGPGDRGDFDNGAWHVSCHLAGAGGVRRTKEGQIAWLEISHDRSRDEYFA